MPEHQPERQSGHTDSKETAAVYVRVSSTGQLGRDGDEDGYSIPAQVKACEREAEGRGATVAKVYVERAESAKSDARPVLQLMMRELPALGVKYLIVHKVDRMARNRLDDATLYQRLVAMGIKLVSASENIDDTPAGQLMHGMLATFAEYYSNNLATEIKKGLRQKHEQGGTPHKPPIGYLSKRELIGNQDIRSVMVDPVRAPLVKLAFTLYATGEWPLIKLADHLEEQGLRSRGTRRYGERPLGNNRISAMLRNPYYKGLVVWNGQAHAGRHESLIDGETFDHVQMLLAGARVYGERPSKHEHYLRGTVVCAECGGRLLYGLHRGRSGKIYEYFSCNNRAARRKKISCSSGCYAVDTVEDGVIRLYPTLNIPPSIQDQIREEVQRDVARGAKLIEREAERHERTLKKIEAKQEKLVQLFYRDRISEEVFEKEQRKLKAEQRAADRLREVAAVQSADLERALDLALSRVDNPLDAYRSGTQLERRIMNKAIFDRIEIGPPPDATGAKLSPVYQALAAWQPGLGELRGQRSNPGQCSAFVRPYPAAVHQGSTCKSARFVDSSQGERWSSFRHLNGLSA
jgi:DNA invertase Pin-like site-specific DNA recombinase